MSLRGHSETLCPLHSKGALPDRIKFLALSRGHIGEWLDAEHALYEDSFSNDHLENPFGFSTALVGAKLMSLLFRHVLQKMRR